MDSYDRKLDELAAFRRGAVVEAKEKLKLKYKARLIRRIETNINTVMIGSLDAMERYFGKLWGQGLSNADKTDEQLEMTELKTRMRNEILNNGNSQKRAAIAAIEEYDVEWKRHTIDLNVRKD